MYHEKLFLRDAQNAPQLKSSLTNEEYLDAISAPRIDAVGRTKTKARSKRKRVLVDIPDSSESEEEEAETVTGVQEGLPAGVDAAVSIE